MFVNFVQRDQLLEVILKQVGIKAIVVDLLCCVCDDDDTETFAYLVGDLFRGRDEGDILLRELLGVNHLATADDMCERIREIFRY